MDTVLFLEAFYSPIYIVFDPLTLFCLFIFSVLLGWGASVWNKKETETVVQDNEPEELTTGYRPKTPKLSFEPFNPPNGNSSVVFASILPEITTKIPMPKGVKPPKNIKTSVGGVPVENLFQGVWNIIPKPKRK